jgi:hypothetical protein
MYTTVPSIFLPAAELEDGKITTFFLFLFFLNQVG